MTKNKNMMIAAAAAVAGAAVYFIRKKRAGSSDKLNASGTPAKRHLKDTFARAKQHSKRAPGMDA